MKIGELAQRSGCNIETVRFYEREGLLDAPERDSNGYRRYAEANLVELNFILHCRSLGMGLPEVRTLRSFQANPELACDEINHLIDRHIDRTHEQIAALRVLEQQLRALRDTCHANRKTSECGIMRNLTQAADGHECSCHSHEGKAVID
ncbi:Cd(II)/Pb(II)-responsive transcriptional regulator [Paralcaligenes ureilyticus]|uniref:Cd(II)/Pb(II)-responsive transcriptional regulator n=1 Tax=Paralcaligenes ureilyticus TaxID=627131 RepID=A0A4R3M472_9BURK|nr:Cd(II)/Pb(II)-responsive transcriptional regulator [Paralcaligenes ureilyticus]TCT07059.1 Cd(II)/Pb(II)-responsive transcriptional regulator [Paralcaligenes ureilyticus]